MHIAVIGTGYVGLVTGACFAEFGVDVTCVDVDEQKIKDLLDGKMPIYEPGLEQLVAKNSQAGRLRFTTDVRQAIEQALVIFLAVGTPPKKDGSPNMRFVEEAAGSIADYMNGYKVIVTKSTVPIGTGEHLRTLIGERKKTKATFGIVSNPEFLREGAAINDFMRPDRVVLGSRDEEAIAIMKDLYRPLYLIEAPFVITSLEAAELTKYAANAFLATKISFINEIANLCDKIGCDVHDVARAIGMDKRIGFEFLHPGPGFGGSCFPKDTAALMYTATQAGYDFGLLEGVQEVNRAQHERMVAKIVHAAGGDVNGLLVAVWGLTFKADTDDLRDSPALVIARRLVELGAKVRGYDPAVEAGSDRVPAGIEVRGDAFEVCEGAHVLAVLTEWDEFRWLDFDRVADSMTDKHIVDGRNLLDPAPLRRRGFLYEGVGR